MGCTIREEIDRCRLRKATHMLINTYEPIKAINLSIGIHTPENFSRFLRVRTGLTPTEYRRQHRDTL